MNQMWGCGDDPQTWTDPLQRGPKLQRLLAQPPVPMTGFILDYARELDHIGVKSPTTDRLNGSSRPICPEQLPVLSGLAQSFAVSDEWFCSVPSQTNTNRAFSLTGTSRGMVNNGFYTPATRNPEILAIEKLGKSLHTDSLPVSTRSIFEVLQSAGYSWNLFWQSEWPPRYLTSAVTWQYTRTLVPFLLDNQFDANCVKINAADAENGLFTAIRTGKLAAFSYIEPKWGGGPSWEGKARLVGNEFHPVADVTVGEEFLLNLYEVLAASAYAQNTLLIITFDENGGTYDHVMPPYAPAPGTESVPLPHAPWDRHDLTHAISVGAEVIATDPTTRTQYGFDFQQYGVRVPTVLVSPALKRGTVFRSTIAGKVFDHGSIIASILELAGITRTRWQLGERVGQAPTFTHLFDAPIEPRNVPQRPFSIGTGRSNGDNVQAGTDYKFAYVGSLWPRAANPRYLGPPRSGTGRYFAYPTIVNPGEEALYRFVPVIASASGAITNMARLRLTCSTPQLGDNRAVRVNWTNRNVHFGAPGTDNADGSVWQIRLLQSRDPQDIIRIGDHFALFSCLPPPRVAVADLVTPDPFQRLMPDPENLSYATTMAGEWALWRIERA